MIVPVRPLLATAALATAELASSAAGPSTVAGAVPSIPGFPATVLAPRDLAPPVP